jgi:hypothetical protein
VWLQKSEGLKRAADEARIKLIPTRSVSVPPKLQKRDTVYSVEGRRGGTVERVYK